MPTPITRGAASALSFGFLSVSKTRWITFGTATFSSVSSKLDASLNLVNVTYAGNNESPIYKIGNDGIVGYRARKYSSSGNFGYDTNAVAVDTSTGYTWTAGLFSNYFSFSYFGLIAAYDSSNNLALIKYVNNTAYAPYTDIKVSGSNIVVCGDYLDTGTFTYGVHVGVLTKSTGLYSLSRILTSATELYSRAVTVDGSGNIYALGTLSTFATATYIFKYNSSMVLQWQTAMTSTKPTDITTDSSGDVYICADNSVQKFNSAGTLQWQRTIATGVAYRSVAFSKLTIDSSNNIYAVGTMTDTQSTTYYYAVIVKYNSSGTLQWTRVLYRSSGSNPQVFGNAISIDNTNGNFYISGKDTGGPYLLTAKLPIDGTLTGSYSQASPAVTYTYSDPGWTDAAGAFTQTTPTFTDAAGTTAQATPTSPASQNLTNPFYKLPV